MADGMLTCSNCGKRIPAIGKVCPYCHVDKSKDKIEQGWIIAGVIVGGLVGAVIAPDICAATWYAVIGALVLGMAGAFIGKAASGKNR